ncbi:MAG: TrmB family transcriptional regulator [Candidatus Helarchaeota archaeon]
MESFLGYFNLNLQEIKVYEELFNFKDVTVKELEALFEISKAKIYLILSKLEDKGLITSKTDGKTKMYNVTDPNKLISLRNKIMDEIKEKSETAIYELNERYHKLHSKSHCLLKPTHFLFTNRNLSLLKLKEYIINAKKELIFSGVPLWIIDEVKDLIKQAQDRGCIIKIFIADFEVIPKQYKVVKDFFPKLIKIPHYQVISVNGENYFNCEILVDRIYMVSLTYNDKQNLILQSFAGFNCINQCILPGLTKYLAKEEPIKFSSKEKIILDTLKQVGKPMSKKELSSKTGLSGKSLNILLEKLQNENKIILELRKHGKGRPREEVSIPA